MRCVGGTVYGIFQQDHVHAKINGTQHRRQNANIGLPARNDDLLDVIVD